MEDTITTFIQHEPLNVNIILTNCNKLTKKEIQLKLLI